MKLPGKLTDRHIEAAINRGDTYIIYKNQPINIVELWKQILNERRGNVKQLRGHNGLSEKPKKNKVIGKSDIDSSPSNSTE